MFHLMLLAKLSNGVLFALYTYILEIYSHFLLSCKIALHGGERKQLVSQYDCLINCLPIATNPELYKQINDFAEYMYRDQQIIG